MSSNVPKRLVLFVDAQNVYRRARGAFFNEDLAPSTDGQVHPAKIASLIAERQREAGHLRTVHQVRIYTGYNTPQRNSRGYAAYRRQRAAWEAAGCIVTARPLLYPADPTQKPREKGIDVSIAIDMVRLAMDNAYDVGVLFSIDGDLLPALELIRERCPQIMVQTVAWHSDASLGHLRVPYGFHHKLTRADYDLVHDATDYAPESPEDLAARLSRRFPLAPSN